MPEDVKITCFIDEKQVDCETWGDPISKEEGDEIESHMDFLSMMEE